MKKILYAFTTLLVFSSFSYAQQWNGSSSVSNNIFRLGDISVYYGSPNQTTLGAAWGGSNIGYGTGYLGFNLSRNNHSDGAWVYSNDGANNGGGVIYGDIFGNLLFSTKSTSGNTSGTLQDIDIYNSVAMRILNSGKVYIGTTQGINYPGNYKLYVEGGILTEMVKVSIKNSADWSDYVFHKNYKKMPLSQVSNYVKIYKHLPGLPSAEEVVKTGIDIGQMTSKLLGKIEELTLYVIDINNENLQLKEQIKALQIKSETDKAQTYTLIQLQEQIELLKKKIASL